MRRRSLGKGGWMALLLPLWLGIIFCGCKAFTKSLSDRLTHWKMLDQGAVEDPIKAVGGDGVVFAPKIPDQPLSRSQLASAAPQQLVAYYSPVFVQQRVNTRAQRYPYPPEYDMIGEARLRRGNGPKFKAIVAGPPKVYAIYQKKSISGHDHVQLTYTAWYPAHPRTKSYDVEEADIDSCVVRVTLDPQNVPLFYETIAACGCFHKAFVQKRLEEAAARSFGPPEQGKKFSVERTLKGDIDWEVAGVVDEPPDRPRRPVVFIKAGDHKVLGMGSEARLRVPRGAEVHPYDLVEYSDLYAVSVEGSAEKAPFFDVGQGGKVWGAERKKERFFMKFLGVDNAGQPRANDQIKMHFDQSTWGDSTIYERFLRLPPGTL
jgi:hypothetical protein